MNEVTAQKSEVVLHGPIFFQGDADATEFGSTMTDADFVTLAQQFDTLRHACKFESPLSIEEKFRLSQQIQFTRRAIQAWARQHPM